MYWESGGIGPRAHSLTSTLDGGGWSASRLARFAPRERAPCTHWIGGWVGPRAGLDAVSKGKIPSLLQKLNPDYPIVQLVASRYPGSWLKTATLKTRTGKGKLSLCLIKHHAIKTYWRMEIQLHAFLTWVLYGGEWSALRLGRFTPGGRTSGTHWTGACMGPRAGLDTVERIKISSPCRAVMFLCGILHLVEETALFGMI
jgi:hypothetical protein